MADHESLRGAPKPASSTLSIFASESGGTSRARRRPGRRRSQPWRGRNRGSYTAALHTNRSTLDIHTCNHADTHALADLQSTLCIPALANPSHRLQHCSFDSPIYRIPTHLPIFTFPRAFRFLCGSAFLFSFCLLVGFCRFLISPRLRTPECFSSQGVQKCAMGLSWFRRFMFCLGYAS